MQADILKYETPTICSYFEENQYNLLRIYNIQNKKSFIFTSFF